MADHLPHSSRSLSLWMPRLTSAETEFSPKRDKAAARMRDLATSSAYGANVLRVKRDNVIGPSFKLALRCSGRLLGISNEQASEWSREAESHFEAYANAPTHDCDAARVLTFPWQIAMAYLGQLQSGEALGVLKWKPSASGYNTCLLMVEPERLSNPPDKLQARNLRNGVETDDDGAPIAYYIRNVHPTDVHVDLSPDSYKWTRVPRATKWGRPIVLHMLDRTRPDMRRGITQFVAGLPLMKMTDTHDMAELEANILRTLIAATIKTDLDVDDAKAILGAVPTGAGKAPGAAQLAYMQQTAGPFHKELNMTLGGARIAHLLPGEELDIKQALSGGLEYEAFQKVMVRKLASALGVSAEQLGRDFTQMSFASARMSLEDIWRHFIVSRELVIRQFAMPFVMAWMEEAIDSQRLSLPNGKMGTVEDFLPLRAGIFARSTFMSWGPPQVDPVKERDGQRKAIEVGLSTLQDEAYQGGFDWEENLEQIARERQLKDKLKIPQLEEIDAPPPPPPGEDGDGPPQRAAQ